MGYFVSFSRNELLALRLLDSFDDVGAVTSALRVSTSQAYRVVKKLKEKEAIGGGVLVSAPYLKKLVLLLRKHPNLVSVLRDSNLAILLQLLSPKTVKEVSGLLGCDEQTVYKLIQGARRIGLVLKIKNQFVINGANWALGKEFLEDLLRQEMSFDKRVPKDSVIYFKSEKEILFSTNATVDASRAAFSAFADFGVKVLPVTNYYFLPKKKLSVQEVFDQALLVTKTDFDYRNLVFLAIFLLKHTVKSNDEIVKNLYRIFGGISIDRYPSKKDLQEKAKLYEVSLP
jgi:predicted transcriptional regulator